MGKNALPVREELPDNLGELKELWNGGPAPPAPPTEAVGQPVQVEELRFVPDRVLCTVVVGVERQRKNGTWRKVTEVSFPNVPVMADAEAEELEFGVSLEKLLEGCRRQAPLELAKAQQGS